MPRVSLYTINMEPILASSVPSYGLLTELRPAIRFCSIQDSSYKQFLRFLTTFEYGELF